jgi:hypothetical protein
MNRFACLVLFAIVPSLAAGQTPADQLPGLAASNLQTVYLTDRSGTETTGKLLSISRDSLALMVNGTEQRFEMASVDRIQKRDSLKNGTLTGAVVGVVMGIISAGISDCSSDFPGGSCPGFRVAAFATSVGAYTAIGAGIDALVRGRSTIYTAPPSARAQAAAPRRAAFQVGFSW